MGSIPGSNSSIFRTKCSKMYLQREEDSTNYIKSVPRDDLNLLFDRDGFEYSMMLCDVMGKEFNFLKETLMHRF